MRVAILKTGAPPDGLAGRFGGYPGMFAELLKGEGRSFKAYDVTAGVYPEPGAFDAILITGSPAGAYDPLPWIAPLKDFLRDHASTPMVGICFGHQIMAEAFGGKVIKSPKGWGIGLQRYQVVRHEPWMDPVDQFAIPGSHQDQVVEQPPHSVVVAASDFTPFAALTYTDKPAISFQGHPEFDPIYADALIENRRGTRFSDEQADAAVSTLHDPNDRLAVGRWIGRFLEQQMGR